MKLSTILGTACACVLFTAVNARAAVLANYPFTGSSLASTDTSIFTTASAISLGTGLDDTTRFATANGNPAPALRINTDETGGTTFATAVTAADFFTFSVTPVVGGALELTTLTFDLAVSGAAVTSNVLVQLSANGTTYVNLGNVTGFNTTTFTPESFSLTPANAALDSGAPLYVRFVFFDNANSATSYTALDNIAVTGAVTALVPEPGTNALLALGALVVAGAVVTRRRATA